MPEQDTRSGAHALPEIAGYQLLRPIAQGGMSIVYLARQTALGRDVAVKVMRPEALADEVSRRRFENEARTIGRLEHPHIVGIHQIGRTGDGLPYYAMPYLAHGHLGQRDFRGDEAAVRAILDALLQALAYAHGRGVIHRDVKAENVLFDEAGRPLLADFGIALRRGYGSRVTSAGLAVGSTAYMAPEQARGEEVDPRADLYSVGVLAWEMLTGQLPYRAQDALSMAVMHAQDPIPRLPPQWRHWQRFIDRAMAKYPLKRFHDADHMRTALRQVPAPASRRGLALRRSLAGLWTRLARRPPRVVWVAGGLLLAAGIGLWLRPTPSPGSASFFRAQAGDAPRAAPAATTPERPRLGHASPPDDALLRAAPESPAGRLIAQSRRLLAAGRLMAPPGDNAYDSLQAAAQADPQHLELAAAATALVTALGREAVSQIQAGAFDRAAAPLQHASRLLAFADPAAQGVLADSQRRAADALQHAIDAAALRFEREPALHLAATARSLDLPASLSTALRQRADAIPATGEPVRGQPAGMVVMQSGDGAYALAQRMVSLDEYRAFAEATQRPAARCRERASVMRMLSPRDWSAPGFEQTGGDAVVCVSWDDADAYLRWLSSHNGARYRLPTATEAAALSARSGATEVAEWLLDCNGACTHRQVHGSSWRRDAAPPRDTARGYDDVGFRLVFEP